MMPYLVWVSILAGKNFMPHGMCYQWEPVTLWSNVIGDGLTALAYFLIPIGLIYFVRKRKDFDMPGVVLAFAAFIISCGAVHAISVVNVWVPLYRVSGVLKGVMAVASLGTLVMLYIKMPLALSIPAPSELQKVNRLLLDQIREKELLQKQLEEKAAKLEETVKLLNDTQEAASIGAWRLDLRKDEMYWSDEVYKIHEVDKSQEIRMEDGINFYNEDCREDVINTVEQAVSDGKSWDKNWLLNVGEDKTKWVRAIGYPVKENGEIIALEGLFMDKDEQIRAELKLIERSEKLEEKNNELEAFSYSISHDLRAPLRSINGFADILKEDFSDKIGEEGRRLLTVIKDNALKMGTLIDDILLYSRVGRQEPSSSEIDMNSLMNAIIKDLTLAYNNLKIKVDISELPTVNGDLILIKQLFQNLIDNAIKYSSKNEEVNIRIGYENSEQAPVFFVKDNGVGFDAKYHDKLFGVFQRLHSSNDFSGTGVGLAIVKRIVEKHKGKIWAESTEGKGATFFVTINGDRNEHK